MKVQFESLTENDLEETYNLCRNVFGEFDSLENIKKTYDLCKDDPHYYFIVGKVDNKIVAYTTMIIFYDIFDGPYPIATLWYVCVDENYRRQGIATQMFEEIERIANENHCEIMYFTSQSDNYSAHKFYRSVGYSDTKEKAFVKYLYEEWDTHN
jgi:ribosomal protein S18 acetylase RimI-like enzyme